LAEGRIINLFGGIEFYLERAKSFSYGITTERNKRPRLDFYIGGNKISFEVDIKKILAVQKKIKIDEKKIWRLKINFSFGGKKFLLS